GAGRSSRDQALRESLQETVATTLRREGEKLVACQETEWRQALTEMRRYFAENPAAPATMNPAVPAAESPVAPAEALEPLVARLDQLLVLLSSRSDGEREISLEPVKAWMREESARLAQLNATVVQEALEVLSAAATVPNQAPEVVREPESVSTFAAAAGVHDAAVGREDESPPGSREAVSAPEGETRVGIPEMVAGQETLRELLEGIKQALHAREEREVTRLNELVWRLDQLGETLQMTRTEEGRVNEAQLLATEAAWRDRAEALRRGIMEEAHRLREVGTVFQIALERMERLEEERGKAEKIQGERWREVMEGMRSVSLQAMAEERVAVQEMVLQLRSDLLLGMEAVAQATHGAESAKPDASVARLESALREESIVTRLAGTLQEENMARLERTLQETHNRLSLEMGARISEAMRMLVPEERGVDAETLRQMLQTAWEESGQAVVAGQRELQRMVRQLQEELLQRMRAGQQASGDALPAMERLIQAGMERLELQLRENQTRLWTDSDQKVRDTLLELTGAWEEKVAAGWATGLGQHVREMREVWLEAEKRPVFLHPETITRLVEQLRGGAGAPAEDLLLTLTTLFQEQVERGQGEQKEAFRGMLADLTRHVEGVLGEVSGPVREGLAWLREAMEERNLPAQQALLARLEEMGRQIEAQHANEEMERKRGFQEALAALFARLDGLADVRMAPVQGALEGIRTAVEGGLSLSSQELMEKVVDLTHRVEEVQKSSMGVSAELATLDEPFIQLATAIRESMDGMEQTRDAVFFFTEKFPELLATYLEAIEDEDEKLQEESRAEGGSRGVESTPPPEGSDPGEEKDFTRFLERLRGSLE
ncbi:MAG: hypothetical protein HQL63_16205, partial [Magnetococcales bacterium]|nr:hypothetical protein [Magnetococcales bacterium]